MSSNALNLKLDVKNLVASRTATRANDWELDFEKNHKDFAENIALGIVRHVIENLGKILQDPYAKSINSRDKEISYISLDITKSRSAKKIVEFAASAGDLPPFKEWLTKFSIEQNQSNDDYFDGGIKSVDRKYFQELMALVGGIAAKKINELLVNFSSNPHHADLQFKVEWYRKSDQLISNPSDFRDNCLCIELWFKNEATVQPSIRSNASTTITQHRLKQTEIQQLRARNNLLVAVAILIMGFIIFKSGLMEINLPSVQYK